MIRQAIAGSLLAIVFAGGAVAQTATGQSGTPATGQSGTTGAAPAGKANGVEMAPGKQTVIPAQTNSQMLAGKLMSADVVGSTGDKIGQVKDLILDKDGKTVGFVVGVGGVLGIGAKGIGVPFERVKVAQGKESDTLLIRTNLTKDEIEAAPEFKTVADRQDGSPTSGK